MKSIQQLNAVIESIANAEKVTKLELGMFSRDVIFYVAETKDIQPVNALLKVLTPANNKAAVQYFAHFLPYNWDKEAKGFSNMNKKKADDMFSAVLEWLEDDTRNLWVWLADQGGNPPKAKEYAKKVENLVKKSLEDEAEGISEEVLLNAIIAGGLSAGALLNLLAKGGEQEAEQVQEAA